MALISTLSALRMRQMAIRQRNSHKSFQSPRGVYRP
nr:MAG TPA: hypothetical protein [Caudoviricetes sp.]